MKYDYPKMDPAKYATSEFPPSVQKENILSHLPQERGEPATPEGRALLIHFPGLDGVVASVFEGGPPDFRGTLEEMRKVLVHSNVFWKIFFRERPAFPPDMFNDLKAAASKIDAEIAALLISAEKKTNTEPTIPTTPTTSATGSTSSTQ